MQLYRHANKAEQEAYAQVLAWQHQNSQGMSQHQLIAVLAAALGRMAAEAEGPAAATDEVIRRNMEQARAVAVNASTFGTSRTFLESVYC